MKAYARNPHILTKLIRFTGYIPANIIDHDKKLIAPIKILQKYESNLLKANEQNAIINISYEGNQYKTKIAKILLNNTEHNIDELILMVED